MKKPEKEGIIKYAKGSDGYDLMLLQKGYNQCCDDWQAYIDELADVERIRDKVIDIMNKDKEKNTGVGGHSYSVTCSCGVCHSGNKIAEAISPHIKGAKDGS